MEIILSTNDNYKKVANLSKWTSDAGNVSHWVNIRTFWFNGEEWIPTKNGVMLMSAEFWEILTPLNERKAWPLNNSNSVELSDPTEKLDEKELRTIRLRKNEKYSFMMDIILTTDKGESVVSLTIGEIGKLISNKRKIYNYFKEN